MMFIVEVDRFIAFPLVLAYESGNGQQLVFAFVCLSLGLFQPNPAIELRADQYPRFLRYFVEPHYFLLDLGRIQ